jgi:hypothetical protein
VKQTVMQINPLQPILAMVIVLFTSNALADVDVTCASDCMNRGYLYQFCQQQCSYNTGVSGGAGGGFMENGGFNHEVQRG